MDVSTPTPAGLTHVSATTTSGTYNAFSGNWRIPLVAGGDRDTLRIRTSVDPGTLGDTITRTVSLSGLDQTDTDSSNDVDSVDVLVTADVADASVSIVTDEPFPSEGEEVTLTVDVTNAGPNDANGLVVGVPIPAGLSFVSAVSDVGAYDSGSGTWTVGSVPPDDVVRLTLTVTVDGGTGGSAITVIASITDNDTFDPNADGDADSVTLNVLDPSSTAVSVSSPDEPPQTISPGRSGPCSA